MNKVHKFVTTIFVKIFEGMLNPHHPEICYVQSRRNHD